MPGSLSKLQKLIPKLALDQKQELLTWLIELIEEESQPPKDLPINPKREVVKQRQEGRITYQLERVKCGKESCKCNRGKLHGPYWYGYQRQNGKLRSWYIGKTFKIES